MKKAIERKRKAVRLRPNCSRGDTCVVLIPIGVMAKKGVMELIFLLRNVLLLPNQLYSTLGACNNGSCVIKPSPNAIVTSGRVVVFFHELPGF